MTSNPDLEELNSKARDQIAEAYRRGFLAGAADTRDRILKAVSAGETPVRPVEQKASVEESGLPSSHGDQSARVERGAVRLAVQHVMAARPGLTAPDVSKRVTEYDPRITAFGSVSNELNRNEGKLYERRDGLWYPIYPRASERDQNAEGPATDVAGPSQSNGAAVSAA